MFHWGITAVLLRCYLELIDAGKSRSPDTCDIDSIAEKKQ